MRRWGQGQDRARVNDTWEALTENLDWSVAFRVPDLLVSLFQGIRLQQGNTKRYASRPALLSQFVPLMSAVSMCTTYLQALPRETAPEEIHEHVT